MHLSEPLSPHVGSGLASSAEGRMLARMCCRIPHSRHRAPRLWRSRRSQPPPQRDDGSDRLSGVVLPPSRGGVQLTNYSDRDICTVRGVKIYLSGRVETPRHSSDATPSSVLGDGGVRRNIRSPITIHNCQSGSCAGVGLGEGGFISISFPYPATSTWQERV